MINWLPLLLINRTTGTDLDIPGDFYSPPGFVQSTYPDNLENIRSMLFGSNADNASKNYRMLQLLSIIHSSELGKFVLDIDSRVTYLPIDSRFARGLDFGIVANQTFGTSTPLYFQGVSTNYKTLGPIYQRWTLTALDLNTIQVSKLINHTSTNNVTLAFTGGLSNNIPLTGSQFSVIVGQYSSPFPVWSVTSLSQPLWDIPDILNSLDSLGSLGDVFGINQPEPYPTLSKLWINKNISSVYRIAAATVGIGYKLNDYLKTIQR